MFPAYKHLKITNSLKMWENIDCPLFCLLRKENVFMTRDIFYALCNICLLNLIKLLSLVHKLLNKDVAVNITINQDECM